MNNIQRGINTRQNIYIFIKDFIDTNKYSPTVREICAGVGINSTSTISQHLIKMRNAGLIYYEDYLPRTIRITKEMI